MTCPPWVRQRRPRGSIGLSRGLPDDWMGSGRRDTWPGPGEGAEGVSSATAPPLPLPLPLPLPTSTESFSAAVPGVSTISSALESPSSAAPASALALSTGGGAVPGSEGVRPGARGAVEEAGGAPVLMVKFVEPVAEPGSAGATLELPLLA